MEFLKRSLDEIEPPTCPNCHIEMKWYRSVKVAEAPLTIDHFFMCPHCSRVSEMRSIVRAQSSGPPSKLSAPVCREEFAA